MEGGKKPTPLTKLNNAAEKQSACLELFTFLSTLLRSSFNSFKKSVWSIMLLCMEGRKKITTQHHRSSIFSYIILIFFFLSGIEFRLQILFWSEEREAIKSGRITHHLFGRWQRISDGCCVISVASSLCFVVTSQKNTLDSLPPAHEKAEKSSSCDGVCNKWWMCSWRSFFSFCM